MLRSIVVLAVAFSPVAAFALPVTGGNTVVQVTANLAGLGLTPTLIGSATAVSASPLTLNFPITGGQLSSSLAGHILHNGSGVSLSAGTNTLSLSNFDINTVAQEIFGDVSLNGSTLALDAPLFSFNLSSVTTAQLTNLASPALALSFTSTAANALTQVFAAPDLTGAQFGLAATAPTLGTAVPEPATLAVLGLGIVSLTLARRRA